MEVEKINTVFLKRYASKRSEKTLSKFMVLNRTEEKFLSNLNTFKGSDEEYFNNLNNGNIQTKTPKNEFEKKILYDMNEEEEWGSHGVNIREESETGIILTNEEDKTLNPLNLLNPINSNRSSFEDIFTLPKRKNSKKIFEEFLTIGIEDTGLEYLTDHDELYLTPKILFNYPNKLQENELKFNIKFLKNFCFSDGVKVKKYIINNQEDYEHYILESNFFSKYKLSFCLVQQVTTEDVEKYFVFGIKFDDIYIVDSQGVKNIFVYDKTFLFISTNPLFKLFEAIFQHILNIKKLNFFKNLDSFELILENKDQLRSNFNLNDMDKLTKPSVVSSFEKENNEKVKFNFNTLDRRTNFRNFTIFL